MKSSWITLEEARDLSFGQIEWWRCRGTSGEQVEERQYDPQGPPDRPVRLYDNGAMYLGGWKGKKWHGFGIQYRKDGYIRVWNFDEGKFFGPGMLLWLPAAPSWMENRWNDSTIQTMPMIGMDGRPQPGVGLPFIYIGQYRKDSTIDHSARVILKDGTTRIGPWKEGKPMGDFWERHVKTMTSQEEIARLLAPLAPRPSMGNMNPRASFARRGSSSGRPSFRPEDAFQRQSSVLGSDAFPNQASFSRQESFMTGPSSNHSNQDVLAGRASLMRQQQQAASAMQLSGHNPRQDPSMQNALAGQHGSLMRQQQHAASARQLSVSGHNPMEEQSMQGAFAGRASLMQQQAASAMQLSASAHNPRPELASQMEKATSFRSNPRGNHLAQFAPENATPLLTPSRGQTSRFVAQSPAASDPYHQHEGYMTPNQRPPSRRSPGRSMSAPMSPRHAARLADIDEHSFQPETPLKSNVSTPEEENSRRILHSNIPTVDPLSSSSHHGMFTPAGTRGSVSLVATPKQDASDPYHPPVRSRSVKLTHRTEDPPPPAEARRSLQEQARPGYSRQLSAESISSNDTRESYDSFCDDDARPSSDQKKTLLEENSDGEESPNCVVMENTMNGRRHGMDESANSSRRVQRVDIRGRLRLSEHSQKREPSYLDHQSSRHSNRRGSQNSGESGNSFAMASDDERSPASVVVLKDSNHECASDLDASAHSQQRRQRASQQKQSHRGDSRDVSFKEREQDSRRESVQVTRIADWLRDEVIGRDGDIEEILSYAEHFVQEGFHSINVIQETCVANDLAFMKTGHKRIFLARAYKHDRKIRQRQLDSISDWLANEVISYGADQVEMDAYAQKLYDEGFHSIEMIQDVCTEDDIAGWMKRVHRRLFLARAELKHL